MSPSGDIEPDLWTSPVGSHKVHQRLKDAIAEFPSGCQLWTRWEQCSLETRLSVILVSVYQGSSYQIQPHQLWAGIAQGGGGGSLDLDTSVVVSGGAEGHL